MLQVQSPLRWETLKSCSISRSHTTNCPVRLEESKGGWPKYRPYLISCVLVPSLAQFLKVGKAANSNLAETPAFLSSYIISTYYLIGELERAYGS